VNDETGYRRIAIGGPKRQKNLDRAAVDRTHRQVAADLYSGALRGTLHTLTPLHIGVGQIKPVDALVPPPANPENIRLAAAFFREDGKLCIPGSSLKGAFRHLYEAVTYSCLAQTHRDYRASDDLRSCYYRADTRQATAPLNLCPACRVFGAQGYMGQVSFRTAHLVSGTTRVEFAPQRWEPKIRPEHERTRKIYAHIPTGDDLMEPLEVVEAGAQFDFKMDFRSLEAVDLGVLLMLFGFDANAQLYPKLGGAKAHGFGAIEIADVALTVNRPEAYYLGGEPEPFNDEIQSLIDGARGSDDVYRDGWDEIVRILRMRPQGF